MTAFTAVAWDGDAVRYLDQRRLPRDVHYERAQSVEQLVDAIRTLAVRGAPWRGAPRGFLRFYKGQRSVADP